MKKTICMILCLVMCVGLLAACGGNKEQEDTSKGVENVDSSTIGNLNTGSGSTVDSVATPPPADAEYYDDLSMFIGDKVAIVDPLNPGSATSQVGIIYHMIFDTLIYFTIQNEYEPCLATEWSFNDDASEWTFKLRDDVDFHNGEHFTADDVIFTIESAHEAVGGGLYTCFNQVEEITANGDYEVTMKLSAPNFDFVYDCSNTSAVMVNRDAYESGTENPGWIGTGPFKLDSMIPNDSLSYVANEDYWGTKALCKTFTMRYIAEETARNIMLENDEFTFANIGNVYIPQYQADDRFVINSYVMNNCNFLGFNMRKPITSDINFRKAVAYAVDVQAAIDIALGGYGVKHDTGALWGYTTAYKDETIPEFQQDIEKAKEYLAQSSYNGEEVELCAGMAQTIKLAEVYMQQLQEIGINAKVHEFDGPSLTAATVYETNDLDIVVTSSMWTPLAASGKAYWTPGNRGNVAGYENQEIIDLFAQAAATPDGPERGEMYKKIQQLTYEDLPYFPTHHMALYIAAQKGAGGNILFPTNFHDYGAAYRLKLN